MQKKSVYYFFFYKNIDINMSCYDWGHSENLSNVENITMITSYINEIVAFFFVSGTFEIS